MLCKRFIVALLLLLVAPAATAAEANCDEATTTAEMRLCANARYEAADRTLNQVYRDLAQSLGEERRSALLEAQRAWIAFRDKSAAFAASEFQGGTLYPLAYVSALTALTEKRIMELEAALRSQ